MLVKPIKTHKITTSDTDVTKVLDQYLPHLEENSILAISSKIVAICEGDVVKVGTIDKDALVKREAEYYLPREENTYGIFLTMKYGLMIASAGIDESNGNGYYILWPKDPQQSANMIREYLLKKFGLKYVGVIITDSKTIPLRRGITGITLRYSGFAPLKNYIGEPDIFGKHLGVTKANLTDGLAAAAVAVMGEGEECTPIAVLNDLPAVVFQDRNPTKEEIEELYISMEKDIFSKMLKSANWRKGGGSSV